MEAVELIANEKIVEELVKNICGHIGDDEKDLIQDLYLDLLSKPPGKIEALYTSGQIRFFIARMITNNVFSTTSPYYTKYKKKNFERLDEHHNDTPDIHT